jgi:hypothetical protein
MQLPEPMSMGFEELVEYTRKLQEALIPFAHAVKRLESYGDYDRDNPAPLYSMADGSNCVNELLAFDPDVLDPTDLTEDCRRLTVQDLDVAGLALFRGE